MEGLDADSCNGGNINDRICSRATSICERISISSSGAKQAGEQGLADGGVDARGKSKVDEDAATVRTEQERRTG